MIRFFVAEGGVVLRQKRLVRGWLDEIVVECGGRGADLNYIFCGDEYLYRINLEFLHHDTYTDIITFSENTDCVIFNEKIRGECYISTDRVAENAAARNLSYTEELHRVMVHGLFHLLGRGDKTKQEKAIMRQLENSALQKRRFIAQNTAMSAVEDAGEMHSLQSHPKERGADLKETGAVMFHVEQVAPALRGNEVAAGAVTLPYEGPAAGPERKPGAVMFHVEQAAARPKRRGR